MALSSRYKFYLQEASIGSIEVNPLIESLEFTWDKNDISRDLVKGLSSTITLMKSEYEILLNLDNTNTCAEVLFRIEKYCGGAWVLDFEGLVNLNKCTFDTHQCRVDLDIESKSIHKCVTDISSTKVNVINNTPKFVVKTLEGFIETQTCPLTPFSNILIDYNNRPVNDACITTGQAWTLYSNNITLIISSGNPSRYNCEIETTWIRQRVNGGTQPFGIGWIPLGADWVRPVSLVQDLALSTGDYNQPLSGDIRDVKKTTAFNGATINAIDNGMKLSDVLNMLVNNPTSTCNYTIVSDFFGINPDNTYPLNLAYTSALDFCQSILLYKSADIKRPYTLNNSSILSITLSELLKDLGVLFGVEVSIYNNLGVNYFRIEHGSYFSDVNGEDITVKNIIKGGVYTRDADKLPREERFYFQVQGTGGNIFDSSPILYPSNCSDAKEKRENRADLSVTNLGDMLDNENYPDFGIAVVATYSVGGSLYFISETELNDRLTMPNLIEKFHYYNRPFATGTIDGVQKIFTQKRNKREEVQYSFVDNCSNISFETNKLKKSILGWGEITAMSYDALNCTNTITLLH